jgi:hypothetical protein
MPGGQRKTTIKLRQDIRSRGRELNPGLPKYEAGVLTTHQQQRPPETNADQEEEKQYEEICSLGNRRVKEIS